MLRNCHRPEQMVRWDSSMQHSTLDWILEQKDNKNRKFGEIQIDSGE